MRPLLVSGLGLFAVIAAACSTGNDCSGCKDVDVRIPWGATDSRVYNLTVDGKAVGRATLSVKEDGDQVVLMSLTTDDNGNSDESIVTADKSTLKPISNVHTVIDDTQKRVAQASYESTDDCDTKQVVKIQQLVFDPPGEPTPDDTRSSPLCLPEHAYDNDASLFLWRALPFEKGYRVVYRTVLSNRRATQIIELTVQDKVDKSPYGDQEAWEVRLTADQVNQRAWFSTDDAHKMLAYQNGGYLFLLDE